MPLIGSKRLLGYSPVAGLKNGSPWTQTQHFTLIVQGFIVAVNECEHSRVSVLSTNCCSLHVTLDLALFIM